MKLFLAIIAWGLFVGMLCCDFPVVVPAAWRGLCWLTRWVAVLMLWAIVIVMLGALLHIGWETGRYALQLWGHQ